MEGAAGGWAGTGRRGTLALVLSAAIAGLPSGLCGQAAPAVEPSSDRTAVAVASADYTWTLLDLDGAPFRLDRYRGRVLVLNVWATWCAPCVRELASLERLAGSLADTDVAFLLVSPERPATVRRFLGRYGYELPAAVEDQRMPASFGLEAVPTTYVIDPGGRVVLVHRGAARWDTPAVRAFLRHLDR
ncbi:MAG: TlpA disulfide reductase family protein [Longimicrobiales bacterium]|nr:TlpA disulfide reductase family protein [Longimicrobiales bacterium]